MVRASARLAVPKVLTKIAFRLNVQQIRRMRSKKIRASPTHPSNGHRRCAKDAGETVLPQAIFPWQHLLSKVRLTVDRESAIFRVLRFRAL